MQQEKSWLSLRASHMAEAAQTDPLTGLLNRNGLAEKAQQLLAQPGQHAVLLLDLDRFKPINDLHGHETGDQVLMIIGERLARHCRTADIASRLGGDEFVLVMSHCPDRPALDAMVRRLCDSVEAPITLGEQTYRVSASIGVAMAPDQGQELPVLLRRADQAMYEAKRSGSRLAFAPINEVMA